MKTEQNDTDRLDLVAKLIAGVPDVEIFYTEKREQPSAGFRP